MDAGRRRRERVLPALVRVECEQYELRRYETDARRGKPRREGLLEDTNVTLEVADSLLD